jgi:hypothetical protein
MMRLLCVWALTVTLFACGTDPPSTEVWGGTEDATIVALYGDYGCPKEIAHHTLENAGLPTALREIVDDDVMLYVGISWAPHPRELGAIKTSYSLRSWELWRWEPQDEPSHYVYILVTPDDRDPIVYERARGECF